MEVADRLMDETGLGRVEVVRRLLNFADTMPDVIQHDMLGVLPGSLQRPDFTRWYLENVLADPPVPPHSGPQVDTLVTEDTT